MLKAIISMFFRTTLLPYEQRCLDGWRASLSDETAREILDKQLGAVRQIQRQAGGAKICFYYADDAQYPLFQSDQTDLHAATVILKQPKENETQIIRVKVYIHRGRFFSLEFPKRPERYALQHKVTLNDFQVARVETHQMLKAYSM